MYVNNKNELSNTITYLVMATLATSSISQRLTGTPFLRLLIWLMPNFGLSRMTDSRFESEMLVEKHFAP